MMSRVAATFLIFHGFSSSCLAGFLKPSLAELPENRKSVLDSIYPTRGEPVDSGFDEQARLFRERQLEQLNNPDFDDHTAHQDHTAHHQEPYIQDHRAQYPANNPLHSSVLVEAETESDTGRTFEPSLVNYSPQYEYPAVDPYSNYDMFPYRHPEKSRQFVIKESKANKDSNRFEQQEFPEDEYAVNEAGFEEPELDEESHKPKAPPKSILNTIFGNIKSQNKQPKYNKYNQKNGIYRFDRFSQDQNKIRSVYTQNEDQYPGGIFPSSRQTINPYANQRIISNKENGGTIYFDDFAFPDQLRFNKLKSLYMNKFRDNNNDRNTNNVSEEQYRSLSISNNMDILRDRLMKAIKRRRQSGRQQNLQTRNRSGGLGALG